MRKTYVVVTRVSTVEQKKGTSHQSQYEGITRSMMVRNWELLGRYSDTVSGRLHERDGLKEILKEIKSGKLRPDYVLVYRWDRFYRNSEAGLKQIRVFRSYGVEINCVDQWIEYNNSMYPVLLGFYLSLAESESLKIEERTRTGLYYCMKKGYWPAKRPFGYVRLHDLDENGYRIIAPHPVYGPLVAECFQRLHNGESKTTLFRMMCKKGITIGKSQFFRLFSNPFYKGVVVIRAYRELPALEVKGRHEALVSAALFDAVQVVKKKRPTPESDFPLKGVIRNPDYSALLTKSTSINRWGKPYSYYHEIGTKCPKYRIGKRKAELAIEKLLKSVSLDRETIAMVRDELMKLCSEKIALGAKLKQTEKKNIVSMKAKLEQLYTLFRTSDISPANYFEAKSRLEDDVIEAENKLGRLWELALGLQGKIEKAMSVLENGLLSLYSRIDTSSRQNLLRILFPEGFTVCKQSGKVRTPQINAVFLLLSAFADLSTVLVLEPREIPVSNTGKLDGARVVAGIQGEFRRGSP